MIRTRSQHDGFTVDPLASHSAQFPLARPIGTPENIDPPSPHALRPWGLRWMNIPPGIGQRLTTWCYDHERQVAVNIDGTPLTTTWMGDPSADKVTSSDGDEGPAEDFIYDFTPDAFSST